MESLLRKDFQQHPRLFWLRPLTNDDVTRASQLWSPPPDLLAFWKEFGIGDIFEYEEVLNPFGEDASIEYITKRERENGFPTHLTAFHIGAFISGFGPNGYECLQCDSFCLLGRYSSLEEWYVGVLRTEFGSRYGLEQ